MQHFFYFFKSGNVSFEFKNVFFFMQNKELFNKKKEALRSSNDNFNWKISRQMINCLVIKVSDSNLNLLPAKLDKNLVGKSPTFIHPH